MKLIKLHPTARPRARPLLPGLGCFATAFGLPKSWAALNSRKRPIAASRLLRHPQNVATRLAIQVLSEIARPIIAELPSVWGVATRSTSALTNT